MADPEKRTSDTAIAVTALVLAFLSMSFTAAVLLLDAAKCKP